MHFKAAVTARRFAFGAGQRKFLAGDRVQKNRKVLAHRLVAQRRQGFRCAADHDPVMVDDRQAQQGIAHRTTDHVNLHGGSLAKAVLLKRGQRVNR